jgi:hypothetical protein
MAFYCDPSMDIMQCIRGNKVASAARRDAPVVTTLVLDTLFPLSVYFGAVAEGLRTYLGHQAV